MARSEITLKQTSVDAFVSATADAIDATNNHSLDLDGVPARKVLLEVWHTTASEKELTVKAGDNPPAVATGLGDEVVACAAGDSTPTFYVLPLDSSRFIQDDGTILIDIEAAMTGFIRAYAMP